MRALDQNAAAAALSEQIVKGEKPVIFMFGAGGSAPRLDTNKNPVTPGVPLAGEVVEIVARHLDVDPSSLKNYQKAFHALIKHDRKGKGTLDLRRANLVIREAVLRALRTPDPSLIEASSAQFAALEADPKQWWIPDAYKALALLGAHYPTAMGGMVLTTNFDPLIEVAMTQARSPWLATALHKDGSLQFTRGSGPHVVHLHGHWWNSDTLHTKAQLRTKRVRLQTSLVEYLKKSTLVVIGYGGWKDVLTRTLKNLGDDEKDVWWGLRDPLDDDTRSRLTPFLGASGRFITDVDADKLLVTILNEALSQRWADDRNRYLDRVLIENNHQDIYSLCHSALQARGSGLDAQARYLEHFEAGLSVIASIHAARFILPWIDQQYVHASYDWTVGSVARLALIEALRIFHDDTADATPLKLVDELLGFYVTDGRIPGRAAPVALNVVKDALCATQSFQLYRRLRRETQGWSEHDLRRSSAVSRYESDPVQKITDKGRVEFNHDDWAGMGVHAAARVTGNDVRSIVQYIRACLDREHDHQHMTDYACRCAWRDIQSKGRDFKTYILDEMTAHGAWLRAKEEAEGRVDASS